MQIELKPTGLQTLRTQLAGFSERRMAAAIATALTRTAKTGAQKWQDHIDQRVDRPNPRTRKAVAFWGANARHLDARIFVKDKMSGSAPVEYLNPQQYGGNRVTKKFEAALIASGAMPSGYITVPGQAAKRDAYGNVSRSLIIAILRQMAAHNLSAGYQQTISKDAGKRRRASRGTTYVAVQPGARISPGIYRRNPDRTLTMMLAFQPQASYSQLLRLDDVPQFDIRDTFDRELDRAIAEHIQRLARK